MKKSGQTTQLPTFWKCSKLFSRLKNVLYVNAFAQNVNPLVTRKQRLIWIFFLFKYYILNAHGNVITSTPNKINIRTQWFLKINITPITYTLLYLNKSSQLNGRNVVIVPEKYTYYFNLNIYKINTSIFASITERTKKINWQMTILENVAFWKTANL